MVFGKKKADTEPDETHTSYQSFSEIASPALNRLFSSRSTADDDSVADPLSTLPDPSNRKDGSDYRGFSSSISDLFADPAHERVDCCSLTCCGILQHDRDRFLVTGVPPPALSKRLVMHVVVPAIIFLAAGLAAMRIKIAEVNQVVSTGLILLMIFYFCLQCGKGRTKRMEIRKDLLFTKHQLAQRHLISTDSSKQPRRRVDVLLNNERPDDGESDNDEEDREYFLGQTREDIRCAHPFCLLGCYRQDRRAGQRTRDDNLCSNIYELCCPDFCGRHFQICGICGIAQEAREVETTILPPAYRRVDYITMQSIVRYYPAIYNHRHKGQTLSTLSTISTDDDDEQQATLFGHPISRLSHCMVQSLKLFLAVMLTWGVIGPLYWSNVIGRRGMASSFQVHHFLVLVLTFLQAFAYIAVAKYLVGRYKDPELSMDATIKYFSSGFFLSASLAIFWEFLTSQIIDTFVALLLAALGVVSIENPESDMASSSILLHSIHGYFGCGFSIGRPEYAVVFGYDHPVLYTAYLFIMTFFVAAFIEELCKYFGFRMVEHPDFLSKKDLHEASVVLRKDEASDEEQAAVNEAARKNFSKQCQSVQAQGAAITLAMVTAAIGFSCCENLLYVFFYSEKSFLHEIGILVERTFFPVHPILAAIQSIGVCARFLENDNRKKLGNIIKTSVLIHGTFDFLIVFTNFVGNLIGQQFQDGDLKISNATEFVSLLLSVLVVLSSGYYLASESKAQRERLALIDQGPSTERHILL